MRDLVPVALPFNLSYSLVGSKQSPYATPKQVIDAAKANPGKLTLANAGRGTGQHILGAAFMKVTATQMLEVPYRGSTAVYPDLLSGRVDLFVDLTTAALPYIKSGDVNGIAILTARRSPHAPDLPTMTEAGVLGLEIDGWVGLFTPAMTPPNAIARFQREIANAMAELKPRFEAAGGEPMDVPPERLKSYLAGRLRQVDQDHPRRRHPPRMTGGRAAQHRDEFATVAHSITSSARARSPWLFRTFIRHGGYGRGRLAVGDRFLSR